MQVMLSVLAIFLFISLVIIHEWGHFKVARRNGVEVEEFGLGIPPRAASKRLSSGLLLSLNWLPLGGFVKLKGEYDSASARGSFGAANLWSKTKILLAGVGMNFIAGLLLLTILGFVGMPVLITQQANGRNQYAVKSDTKIVRQEVEATNVIPGSPADQIGIKSRDTIVSFSSANRTYQIHTTTQLHDLAHSLAGQNVTVAYKHNGTINTKATRLLSDKEVSASNGTKGYLGISLNQLTIQRYGWSSPISAVGFTGQLIWLTLQGLGHALGGLGSAIAGLVTHNHVARVNGQNEAESQVGGPVAIMQLLWASGSLGINFVLVFIAIISLTLALINVLPLPPFDGGRLAMVLISRGIFKKPLTKRNEERFVGYSMLVIIVLMVLITIVDVKRI